MLIARLSNYLLQSYNGLLILTDFDEVQSNYLNFRDDGSFYCDGSFKLTDTDKETIKQRRREMKLPFTAPLVGMRFRPPADEVVAKLWADHPLILARQPDNPHDANAIQVFVERSTLSKEDYTALIEHCVNINRDPDICLPEQIFVGYLAKDKAEHIAPEMDREGATWTAKYSIGDGGKPAVAVEIIHASQASKTQAT